MPPNENLSINIKSPTNIKRNSCIFADEERKKIREILSNLTKLRLGDGESERGRRKLKKIRNKNKK